MTVKKLSKLFVLAFGAAVLSASAAVAAPPATHPGSGAKPLTTGPGCKPQIMVVLHGTVATAPGPTPTLPFSLMVNVTSANKHGKAYVDPTKQPVTITVTSSTKVSRQGDKSLASLLANDKVTVHARTCKADLVGGATPGLTATMVSAHPAAS
jgi:hypothetical protein